MSKTHEFTENSNGMPVTIVLDKVAAYAHDEFSECTRISLVGGGHIHVSETVDEVTAVMDSA